MSTDVKQEEAVAEKFKTTCNECSEIVLYMTINTMGAFIWRMNHDMADGRIPKESHASIDIDVSRMVEQSKYAASKTTRFGVKNPTDSEGKPSEEYWLWFRWWDSYIKALPHDEWRLLEKAINEKADVSSWRPEGDWRESFGERMKKPWKNFRKAIRMFSFRGN